MPLDAKNCSWETLNPVLLSQSFRAGRFHEILPYYRTPAAVFIGERVLVLRNPEEMLRAIEIYHGMLTQIGIVRGETVVLKRDSRGPTRCVYRLKTDHYSADEIHLGETRMNYYVEKNDGIGQICVIAYDKWPAPLRLDDNPMLKSFEFPPTKAATHH